MRLLLARFLALRGDGENRLAGPHLSSCRERAVRGEDEYWSAGHTRGNSISSRCGDRACHH